MFGSFGGIELLLILIIVLIIFGAGKLPQLGEGIGKAIKGFKKSVHEAEEEAVRNHAEPHPAASELDRENCASPSHESLPPRMKDIAGGKEQQHFSRQD